MSFFFFVVVMGCREVFQIYHC